MPQNGTLHTIDNDGWSAGISLRQKVYDFSKTTHRIESAKIRHDIAKLSYKQAAALLTYRVKAAYLAVIVQKKAIEARQKDLEAKKAMLEQADALVAHGLKTKADASRFLSAMKAAEDALAQAKADNEKARVRLAMLIGSEISPRTTLEETVLQNRPRVNESEESVLHNNLTLKIARCNEKAAHESARSAEAEHFGSIDLIADAAHFDTLSSYDSTTLGVRYALPIYTGGRIRAEAQQAKIAEKIAKNAKESARRALMEEVRGVLADIHAARARIEARTAQIETAEETRALIEGRYREGLATYVEVLDAEATLLDARLGLLSALYTRNERIYKLEQLNAQ
jgi:outer membrane protein TolC